ncbi:MAG: DinB family protein [Gemmatimonas sp.]
MNASDDNATNSEGADSLHQRITELLRDLDASRAELRALVSSLPAEVLNAPAKDEQWSVADILEHLSMVEDGAGRLFTNIAKEVASAGVRETDTSSVLALNDAFQIATSPIKVTAPERVAPKAGLSAVESMARLEAAREKLKSAMTRASGLALGSATMPHPLFGPINGYQWVLATSQHEQRHITQLRRVTGFGNA